MYEHRNISEKLVCLFYINLFPLCTLYNCLFTISTKKYCGGVNKQKVWILFNVANFFLLRRYNYMIYQKCDIKINALKSDKSFSKQMILNSNWNQDNEFLLSRSRNKLSLRKIDIAKARFVLVLIKRILSFHLMSES